MSDTIKKWIIEMLNEATRRNFDHNLGVVDGMERILNYLLSADTDKDEDIQAAYKRLHNRLYPTT